MLAALFAASGPAAAATAVASVTSPGEAGEAGETSETSQASEASETGEASEALTRAREAIRAHDYQVALRHYHEALRLQPAPKLHFNIAVCHHRLMAAAEPGSARYEEQRAAAVDAYNHSLEASPGAEDVAEVEALIVALGGTPFTQNPEPWTIELVEPDEVPDAPRLDDDAPAEDDPAPPTHGDDAWGPSPDPTPEQSPEPAPPPDKVPLVNPRGRVGVFIPVIMATPGALARSEGVDALPMIGLGLRGEGFLGVTRRIALGGELAGVFQPADDATLHRLGTGYVGVTLEYRHPLAGGRFEIGGGALVGGGTQAVRFSGDPTLPCSVHARGSEEASRRNGMWANARLYLAALLGQRRNHELSLRLGPGLGAFSSGTVADLVEDGRSCEGSPSAFEQLGLPRGAALVVSIDLGYAPRF